MRPSTSLRIERLTALVAAFSARDLGVADIAGLLQCSASSARNYAFELSDAGIIRCMPGRHASAGVDRTRFGITPDRALVDAFMSVLANPGRVDATRAQAGKEPRAAVGDRGAQQDDSLLNTVSVVQRDPLVAALFGAARRCMSPALERLV